MGNTPGDYPTPPTARYRAPIGSIRGNASNIPKSGDGGFRRLGRKAGSDGPDDEQDTPSDDRPWRMPGRVAAPAVLTMRTFSPPVHRAHRRALAAQLAPAALRTRPYSHPVDDSATDAPVDDFDAGSPDHDPQGVRR